MSRFSRLIPAVAGAIAGGVIALAIASGNSSTHSVTTTTVVAPSSQALPTSFSNGRGLSINQIYKTTGPGVVDILVTTRAQNPGFGFFGGGGSGSQPQSQAEGSGVVYDSKGDILTDEHVVAGADSVKVTFQDGKQYPAKVLGTDSSTDVAAIHVNAPASELHPIPLANSNNAQVGDPVVAIGSPFSLPETATTGIVSQTGRLITAPNGYKIPSSIQTDAAINPGNSGGPLLDASGHVLGLNDQIETNNSTPTGEGSSSGVGFAIPSNTVAQIANQIIAGHAIKHAYVGVKLSTAPTGGATISQVQTGTPAAAAGLAVADIVTAIDGKAISTDVQFIAMIDNNYAPGQTITLTVNRQGQAKQIKVTLGVRPAQAQTGR